MQLLGQQIALTTKYITTGANNGSIEGRIISLIAAFRQDIDALAVFWLAGAFHDTWDFAELAAYFYNNRSPLPGPRPSCPWHRTEIGQSCPQQTDQSPRMGLAG